ncbi:MAG: hypothetical protein LBQ66_11645 [Planctomycetaceae bacterium]|jgi:hypothetical protein|nr:hypothetical protein [Planctomycetaceae bacterium]
MTPDIQTTVETIWTQIEPFDAESREKIFWQIKQKLKKQPSNGTTKTKFRLTDLGGSMRGVYCDPDADDETRRKQIDDYIRGERDSWD